MSDCYLVPQEREDYCVCSVLQGILRKNGISVSQGEIAQGLTPGNLEGFLIADDTRITSFMNAKGFDYRFYWHDETPFNEPDVLLGEMDSHSGFVAIDNHTYLLLGFSDPTLSWVNPSDGLTDSHSLGDVRMMMANLGGGFGLVKRLD